MRDWGVDPHWLVALEVPLDQVRHRLRQGVEVGHVLRDRQDVDDSLGVAVHQHDWVRLGTGHCQPCLSVK